MKNYVKLIACLLTALLNASFSTNAQWTLSGSGATGVLSTPGHVSIAGNLTMGGVSTINSPTQLALYSGNTYFSMTPSGITMNPNGTSANTGVFTIYGSASIAQQVYTAGWYRNTLVNTGLVNSATGTGIFSPGAGRMQIYNNGSLLIGPTTMNAPAGYKLYVAGGILTEKVKVAVVNTAQWADHVFSDNYKLMPLCYVEQYIKKHKHLPNVASAEQMVEEGNDLGKTTSKLLEKIEELTLYVITQQKEIDLLKRELGKLKNEF